MEITSDLPNAYSKSLCLCLVGILYCCLCLLIKPLFLLAYFNQTIMTFLLPTRMFFFPPALLWAHISSFYFLILLPILSILIFLYTKFSLLVSSTSIVKKTITLCCLVTAFFFGTKTVGII